MSTEMTQWHIMAGAIPFDALILVNEYVAPTPLPIAYKRNLSWQQEVIELRKENNALRKEVDDVKVLLDVALLEPAQQARHALTFVPHFQLPLSTPSAHPFFSLRPRARPAPGARVLARTAARPSLAAPLLSGIIVSVARIIATCARGGTAPVAACAGVRRARPAVDPGSTAQPLCVVREQERDLHAAAGGLDRGVVEARTAWAPPRAHARVLVVGGHRRRARPRAHCSHWLWVRDSN